MAAGEGLLHKTKFIPFLNKAAAGASRSWVRIKKSTTFSLAFNPQTKTFDFISDENPTEEIDTYQPALSQSLTMFEGEDDFDLIFNMCLTLPKGGDAHKDALLVFYARKATALTYKASLDTAVVQGKTYYTRTGTVGAYVYTKVTEPTGNPSTSDYYEVDTSTDYYASWLVDSVVKLGTLDSVGQTIDFDLALNNHDLGACTIVEDQTTHEKTPTWVAGTWNSDFTVFTPAAT